MEQNYITVHDYRTPQSNFTADDKDGNGLAILIPTLCVITEELNGTYELYLEHPIDPEGRWKLLEVDNIIKADGQLFRIKTRKTKITKNGDKVRSVKCLHIWYDLADKSLFDYVNDVNGTGWTPYWTTRDVYAKLAEMKMPNPAAAVSEWTGNSENEQDVSWYGAHTYDFTWNSIISGNIDPDAENNGLGRISIKGCNPVNLMIGSECSIANVHAKKDSNGDFMYPELYRDNFYYSFAWKKEHSQENAFTITHTIDMIDIVEDYDASDYYTHIYAVDNFGGQYRNRIDLDGLQAKGIHVPPHAKIKLVEFQYNENEYIWGQGGTVNNRLLLNQDASRYFRSINQPKLTLTCNYAELSDTDLYKDYIAAKHCNVGDSGTVTAAELGVSQVMRVIKKKRDLINPKNVEITFGSKLASITQTEYMSQTINNSKFKNNEYFILQSD